MSDNSEEMKPILDKPSVEEKPKEEPTELELEQKKSSRLKHDRDFLLGLVIEMARLMDDNGFQQMQISRNIAQKLRDRNMAE